MPDPKELQTSLAVEIPPLELDHKAALELLLEQDPKTQTDPDFDAMVKAYREVRRQRAAKMMERDRKRVEREKEREAIAARKAERLAKKAAKETTHAS